MKDRDDKFIMETYFGGGMYNMTDRPPQRQVEEQELPPDPMAAGEEMPPIEGEEGLEEPTTIELTPEEVDVLRAIMMKLPPPEEEEGELPPEGGEMPEEIPPAV